MPYIKVTANCPIPLEKREAIKSQIGVDVQILSKTEDWLMVDFCENSPLYFKGTSQPAALVAIDLYGAATPDAYERFTAALCAMLARQLAIAPDRMFLKYSEYKHWGWNGHNL